MTGTATSTGGQIPRDRRTLRWLAGTLRRMPWSGTLLQRTVRLIQPRYTVGVVGVLLDDAHERVFLVEHVFHTVRPWGLPGGWIGRREDPARAVEREFMEETGLRVRATRPLVVELGTSWRTTLDLVFQCELDGDAEPVRLCHELLDYRWVPLDDLPPLFDIQVRALRAALADGIGGMEDPARVVVAGGGAADGL